MLLGRGAERVRAAQKDRHVPVGHVFLRRFRAEQWLAQSRSGYGGVDDSIQGPRPGRGAIQERLQLVDDPLPGKKAPYSAIARRQGRSQVLDTRLGTLRAAIPGNQRCHCRRVLEVRQAPRHLLDAKLRLQGRPSRLGCEFREPCHKKHALTGGHRQVAVVACLIDKALGGGGEPRILAGHQFQRHQPRGREDKPALGVQRIAEPRPFQVLCKKPDCLLLLPGLDKAPRLGDQGSGRDMMVEGRGCDAGIEVRRLFGRGLAELLLGGLVQQVGRLRNRRRCGLTRRRRCRRGFGGHNRRGVGIGDSPLLVQHDEAVGQGGPCQPGERLARTLARPHGQFAGPAVPELVDLLLGLAQPAGVGQRELFAHGHALVSHGRGHEPQHARRRHEHRRQDKPKHGPDPPVPARAQLCRITPSDHPHSLDEIARHAPLAVFALHGRDGSTASFSFRPDGATVSEATWFFSIVSAETYLPSGVNVKRCSMTCLSLFQIVARYL